MQDESVVEAAGHLHLFVRSSQGVLQRASFPEIERGPVDAGDLSRGNQPTVHGCVRARVDRELMIEDGRTHLTREVEVCMLR